MTIFRLLTFLIFLSYPIFTYAESIENVRFEQKGEQVFIYYDLLGEDEKYDITLKLSNDGGKSFEITPKTIKGDIGENVIPGKDKTIIWSVLDDTMKLVGTEFVFLVESERNKEVVEKERLEAERQRKEEERLEAERRKEEEKKKLAEAERLRKELEAERRAAEFNNMVFSDLTVLDKKTKLMWTRDGNIAGKWMTWYETINFITSDFIFTKSLNKQKYAGYSDWRLPSKEELETLINFAKGQGITKNFHEYFNKIGFKNMQADYYWSSTTYATDRGGGGAWIIHMNNGDVRFSYKTNDVDYVLPVRTGQ